MSDPQDAPTTTPSESKSSPALPPQEPGWSEPIFRAGLFVGCGLLVVGLACDGLSFVTSTVATLVTCSGLGIVFGAFGSTAVIRYKGVVIAGVAAVAIALLLVVDHIRRERLVRLEIDGDVKGARLELFGESAYPGADQSGRSFEFFILGNAITKERLSLIVTLPTSHPETDGADPREIAFDCIPSTAISKFIGAGKTLQWRFDKDDELLTGVDGKSIASGPCPEGGTSRPSFSLLDGFQVVGEAFAQGVEDVHELLADLESDSAAVRRAARTRLAEHFPAAIAPIMASWERQPESYRLRLGVCVALTEYLREHMRERRNISALLTDSQLELLVTAAGDPDRTLRVYASEFLYDLGDRRTIAIAARRFEGASDDGRYNLIVALQGVAPDLSPSDREALDSLLERWQPMTGPRTQQLIAQVRSGL